MEIPIKTTKREESIDITSQVKKVVESKGGKKGKACLVYCQHTTAGITINEGADPAVMEDVLNAIDEIEPKINYKHKEGNSPGHVKSSLVGVSLLVPIENGKLQLGSWQKIFFIEFDGPRERRVIVEIL